MAGSELTDWPVPRRWVVVVAALAVLVLGLDWPSGAGARFGPALVLGVLAGLLAVLRRRHAVRVTGGRLVVGSRLTGGFAVALDAIERWQVLERADAFEVRLALRGMGRVSFLPWLPAAAFLVPREGRPVLVGTRRPEALRAALADAAPAREAVDDIARSLEAAPASRAQAEGPGAEIGSASGGAAALLLVATALFGALVTLIVIDAVARLPGVLALAGAVVGPVVGALVVAEAAARTPLAPTGRAALAALCAGLAPPVAAAVGGVALTGVVFLGLVTVSVAFTTATLHRVA